MAHDHPPHQPAVPVQQAPPATNQNLIIGIIMGAAVLLLLLFVINQQFGSPEDPSGDLAELQTELAEAKIANANARANRGMDIGQSADALGGKIKQDLDSLLQLLAAQQANLDRLANSDAVVRNLTLQNADLQTRLAQANAAAQRIPSLEQQIATLQAQVQSTENRPAQ
jgi:DNA repair exonuclease SbcCD ATPase subunit